MDNIDSQAGIKICNNCGEFKSLSCFYDKGRSYTPYCKKCIIEKQKEYRSKNPSAKSRLKEYSREQSLKSNYNLTKKEYDLMYKYQHGKCAICGTPQSELKKNLCVDHDHKTGKVRALLCTLCNQGLGSFKDNQSNLENALYYLILHK